MRHRRRDKGRRLCMGIAILHSTTYTRLVRRGAKMIRKILHIVAMGVTSLALGICSTYAQQQAPELLFNMTLQNDTRLPLMQNSITTPNVDVQLYGDGKNIIV